MKKLFIPIIFYSITLLAQNPAPAFNPMTARGAFGIDRTEHTLFWENPSGVIYNECYFSSDSLMVANLDTSTRVQNGYPSTVFNSVTLNSLSQNTKYYWSVVEYNASGNSVSPLWYFNSQPPEVFVIEFHFDTDLDGWQFFGPLGSYNWSWSNSSNAGGIPGEMVFRWDPIFIGDSYMISPEIPCPAGAEVAINFSFFEDWWSDTVVVGSAITYDNGNNWTSIWELHATGNVGPDNYYTTITAEGNFRLGFYYTGDSNNIDFLYIDDIFLFTAMEVALPPSFLQAQASLTEQKVTLNWDSGVPLGQPFGYRIQRKDGLPSDNSPYTTLTETNYNTFTFDDATVELNQNYTYRIATLNGPSTTGHYGNEATAYVPETVPVELQNFTADVVDNSVNLKWSTATETNNKGFEILRFTQNDNNWKRIGYVPGFGTTTEIHHYAFVDEEVQAGQYQYRLKQIDFDGTSEYSNIIEATVYSPTIFSLKQNYPNPFNPTTNIKYTIPSNVKGEMSNVSLKVYDILGNEIATLVNEDKPAGTYEIEFDGTNLPSGIYFYKLQADSFVEIKKMTLIK
ncbi:MAG: T9SS type A sorting domain-containing protein [Ignavibacteriaceae bacterium]